MVKLRVLVRTLVMVACLLPAGTAWASSLVVNHLTLDSYSSTTQDRTPAVSTGRLSKGKFYVATVQGTISYYAAIDYVAIQTPFTVFCGQALAAPQFPSQGGVGPVSNDAEFILAQPLKGGACTSLSLPTKWPNFRMNNGKGWLHPNLLSPTTLTRPTASHAYNFAIDGQGPPVSFSLFDPDTRDDYGSFQITVRRAVSSDCAGLGFHAFGLKTRALCLYSMAATKGTVPRLPTVTKRALDAAPVSHVLRYSDIPAVPDVEVPSGALTASQFARLISPSPVEASAETRSLTIDGFVSGAVSEFAGPGLPVITSTAAKLRTAVDAQAAEANEINLDLTELPTGATASFASDPAVPGGEIVKFTPGGNGVGGLELTVAAGDYVDTLRAVQAPDVVSAAPLETLLDTILVRTGTPYVFPMIRPTRIRGAGSS